MDSESIKNRPKVICLTGGIGSGKSFVSDIINELSGCPVIDSDLTTKVSVTEKGQKGYEEIVKEFGNEILDEDGEIVRSALAALVFNNPEKLKKLNGITHPETIRVINKMIDNYGKRGFKTVFVESAIPFAADYDNFCDEFWFIHSTKKDRINRLMKARNYSREKCLSIFATQMSDREYKSRCSVVIENPNGADPSVLVENIRKILEEHL